jgi:acetylornithine deacetylase/succinyl-diaminopimelate desuccinylase-like protein
MVHDTVSPTMLAAGMKVNLVPETAEACCDGRYLPGRTREDFLADVRALIGPDVEIEPFDEAPPLEVEAESELWDVIARVMRRNVPGAEIVPYLIPGMTDAKDYARAGIKCYGFAPVALKANEPFASLYHAPDERVSIAGLEAGFGWLSEVVLEFCA